nr:protein-methionine-sulfoxide reductase heme-binding subunit MsrQ [Caenispirillum salinarum]
MMSSAAATLAHPGRWGRSPALKPAVFALCLVPFAELLLRVAGLGLWGSLGANPVESIIRFSGDWAIRMLLVALAVTPVRELTGLQWLAKLRRMLGLFAFFYAVVHVLAYVGMDQLFAWGRIWADIVKRNYITVGMASFVVLAALAATSPKRMVKALGGRRWQRLHKTVYAAGALAVLHYAMMVKADLTQPLIHAAILTALLAARPLLSLRNRRGKRPAGRQGSQKGDPKLVHRS